METRNENKRPYEVLPPGAILKSELQARGIKQKEFAASIGVDTTALSLILNGKRSISTEFALKLENALGTPASNWLNLQNQYDLWKMKPEQGATVGQLEEVKEETLYAKFSSDKTPLRLGSIELPCYVLNNGLRVFSGRGIQKALGADVNSSGTWLKKIVNSEPIALAMSPDTLEKFNNPTPFRRTTAGGSQSTT